MIFKSVDGDSRERNVRRGAEGGKGLLEVVDCVIVVLGFSVGIVGDVGGVGRDEDRIDVVACPFRYALEDGTDIST